MDTTKINTTIKKKRGAKPGHRSEYNKFVKDYTKVIRNKYELMTRKEQRMLVLDMWKKNKDIYNMCPSIKIEEVEHIAKVLEEMEKEGW